MNSEDRIGLTSISNSTWNLDIHAWFGYRYEYIRHALFAFVTVQFAYFLLLVVFTLKYKQSEVPLPKEQNGTECCAIPPAQGAGTKAKKTAQKSVPRIDNWHSVARPISRHMNWVI